MAITIERVPAGQYRPARVTIKVSTDTFRTHDVTVYGPEHGSPAKVNWSALGAVSAEEAAEYAAAIALGASIAPTLEGETV